MTMHTYNKNKASLEISFMLSLSVHDAFTRGQSLLFKCPLVSASEFKSLCCAFMIALHYTNTVQIQILQ